MTQALTEILTVCRKLVGQARGAGRRVAAAVSDRFGSRPTAGRGFLDVYQLQVAVADELEAMQAGLVACDHRCEQEIERGRALRRDRELSERELRDRLLQLKNGLGGAFDDRAAGEILQPVRQLAAAPAELQQQAEWLHGTLVDPALELPAPMPGVEIDLALVADSLERPAARLGRALAELVECDAAACHARSRRDEEQARLAGFAGTAERFYQALRELVTYSSSSPP